MFYSRAKRKYFWSNYRNPYYMKSDGKNVRLKLKLIRGHGVMEFFQEENIRELLNAY